MITVDALQVNVFKDPITDSGKKSKRGRLRLVREENGQFKTEEQVPADSTLPVCIAICSVNRCDRSLWLASMLLHTYHLA